MFKGEFVMLFNRKKKICSPCSGQIKELSQVDDEVFSKGLAGDGFAVVPEEDLVLSPVDGTVSMIFPTKHAIGIKDSEGKEFIIHIGIDTVKLKGKGFQVLVSENQKVKAGVPLVKVDYSVLKQNGLGTDIIILLGAGLKMHLSASGFVRSGQEVGTCD
jgi:glucose-specific phosphotransferase system IIA component